MEEGDRKGGREEGEGAWVIQYTPVVPNLYTAVPGKRQEKLFRDQQVTIIIITQYQFTGKLGLSRYVE